MTTETTAASAAADADAHPSQIIEHRDTSEIPHAGVASDIEQPKEAAKPLSTRDAIAKAFDEAEKASKAEAAKPEPAVVKAEDAKPKPEEATAKPRAEDGKFAKVEKPEAAAEANVEKGAPEKAAGERAAQDERPSEGRKFVEPPARFLPEARAKWANVPNEVKAEFNRVAQEYEQENQQFKASHERYTQLKGFDDIARTNGRDLRESLVTINQIENTMGRDPIAALDHVLREIGPRFKDGTPLTLYDVAQFVVQQGPEDFQKRTAQGMPPQAQAQVQPAAPQANQEIAQLREQVNALVANQTVLPVVEKFSDGRPDFDALSPRIEQILTSGVIEKLYGTGLSLEQRLSEAYRMAGGQAPSSRSDSEPSPAHSDVAPVARPVDPDGQKSIKGAPTAGQTGEPKWVPKTNREALERAFASHR